MRILLLSRYFPPEIGSTATLFSELATGLVRRGHDVTVATGFPWYNVKRVPRRYRGRLWMKEFRDGIRIIRVATATWGPQALRLASGHLTSPVSSIVGGLWQPRPDVIYAYSPPLLMGVAGHLLGTLKRCPFVLGLQDIHPQCYIDQGILTNTVAIRALENVERFCHSHASAITVHSDGNRDHIVRLKGADPDRVVVVPNWVDTDTRRPLPRRNHFGTAHGLNGRFVVSYAGSLSVSQGLLSLVDAAAQLRHHDDILFLVVGDGVEKQRMVGKAESLKLNNIRFLPMQPLHVYSEVLASSDLSLVFLNAKVKTPVVPSKILSIMAASRPVLASVPLDGDASKLITKAGCGIAVQPEDPRALAAAILQFQEDAAFRQTCAQRGRDYAEEHLSLHRAVRQLESLFRQVTAKRNGGTLAAHPV